MAFRVLVSVGKNWIDVLYCTRHLYICFLLYGFTLVGWLV